jgi:hypothetical protein
MSNDEQDNQKEEVKSKSESVEWKTSKKKYFTMHAKKPSKKD